MDKNRGSQFRKWDLHLHSLESYMNNQYKIKNGIHENDRRKFLEKIKENNIEVIGLTNYFNFTKEDFILKKYLEDNGIITFLNLEIRLSNINKADELFDYHIIFDNTLEQQIIENILGELKANIGDNDKSFNMLSPQEIEKKANISFEKLQEILRGNSALKGKYVTGFLARGHGSATSDSDPKNMAVYEGICKESDFIIHSSCNNPLTCQDRRCNHNNLERDRDYWLNISKYVRPLLQSSDAHSLDQIGEKYSWIKSDKTFEGLRQLIFEPEGRISLERDYPDSKLDYQVIDFIELTNNKKIYLNSSLNTIIGGRSTGKSTLTNSIAKTLQNDDFSPYNEKEKKGMYVFDDDIKITWRNGLEQWDLEFLPQNYMIEIAENTDGRNNLIRNTVKSDSENYSKIEKYEEKTRNNQNKINELLQLWSNLKERLVQLTKPEGDQKGIETELEKLKVQITEQESKSDFSEQETEEYRIADLEFRRFLNNQRHIDINLSHLENIKNIELDLLFDLPSIGNQEFRNELFSYIGTLKGEINTKWQEKIIELTQRYQLRSDENKNKWNEISESEIFKKGQANISNNETLKKLIEFREQESKKLESFKIYSQEKLSIEAQIITTEEEILVKFDKFKELRSQIAEDFKVQATPVEIKLEFQPIKFEEGIRYLNGRSTANNKFIEEFDLDSTKKIQTIFEKLTLSYNQGKNKDDLIKDILSQPWFTINYVLQYDGDDFEHMSQGKKAFVILTLILEFSKDKKPVIIDQPEDSLDNRSIYMDLSMYLKRKKKERQIILVTHNPNIVVGADAENVIVANQHSEDSPNENSDQFSYINGSLEDTKFDVTSNYTLSKNGIREHAIEILEGGFEAFEKREQKYK